MNLADLINRATNKTNFTTVEDYLSFCGYYLDFLQGGIQAIILSQNEKQYQFFQYKDDGNRNVTRPVNTNLMLTTETFDAAVNLFRAVLSSLKNQEPLEQHNRNIISQTIYSVQQSIGATLDALPAGKSNQARKINGDLFERFIQLLINALGINCTSGVVKVPVKHSDGTELFRVSYQHDLLIHNQDELKLIGSVKTSSKDRIDKIFLDKFLYSRLTDTAIPHIAIFLNDVQRKGNFPKYGVNSTFLSGHFKAYTVKLNALDGVYYCDLRGNMKTDNLLKQQIHSIDQFFYTDLWAMLQHKGQPLSEVQVSKSPLLKSENDEK